VIMDPTRKGVGLGGRLGALTPLSRFEVFADPCLSVVLVPSVWVVVLLKAVTRSSRTVVNRGLVLEAPQKFSAL